MNPLNTVNGTIIGGFVIAVIIALVLGPTALNAWSLTVWLHVFAGVIWIGLLYYFNFVQVPAVNEGLADKDGPGPAAISKYVAPRALLWFRMAAAVTFLTGLVALEFLDGVGIVNAFTLNGPTSTKIIGLGAWMGTIMLFNVWVLIWPNQQKILGMVSATDDEIAKAKRTVFLASRTNTLLSIPMLMCMVGWMHGAPI